MKKYQVFYNIFSPSGQQYAEEYLEIYALTPEHVRQEMEKEFRRRLGNLYQWEIVVQQAEDEQLVLF
ncbi:hypothetical protein IIU_06957 [Bacillus cereus VD133]|uniref:Uncharacterized protein n=1 Tax=Bacillus cereus VD133 TaxID=1053233 RepID=A0A9W5PJA3_BACCE|nr:hypothetical protein [Bacillus cereus]EOO23551.1 hypothetical protein IIU_06957 [Bacillus cereus VD133]